MSRTQAPSRRIGAADIAVIAAFAALIIVLGGVTVPVGSAGVPIVLQNMGVAMAGMILGRRRGGLAVLLFLAVGFLGVPNMAGWTPALTAVAGPTVGYIVGYAVIGFVVGALCDLAPRRPAGVRLCLFYTSRWVLETGPTASSMTRRAEEHTPRPPSTNLAWFTAAGAVGVAISYFCGAVGLTLRTDVDFWSAFVSNGAFLPGDIAKTVVAALVSTAVLRAVPDLDRGRRPRSARTESREDATADTAPAV
ncbi:biotin transporter BioY [Corynebacterium provencense]|uniref:biotin transporter BioY n=1 Tax=Corynebacterium provencense TaxID=1737425 RepID=UPI0011CC5B82|nr:biotin transporter BioY [Corynebacterium provencense]